jgi:hypothetical protein
MDLDTHTAKDSSRYSPYTPSVQGVRASIRLLTYMASWRFRAPQCSAQWHSGTQVSAAAPLRTPYYCGADDVDCQYQSSGERRSPTRSPPTAPRGAGHSKNAQESQTPTRSGSCPPSPGISSPPRARSQLSPPPHASALGDDAWRPLIGQVSEQRLGAPRHAATKEEEKRLERHRSVREQIIGAHGAFAQPTRLPEVGVQPASRALRGGCGGSLRLEQEEHAARRQHAIKLPQRPIDFLAPRSVRAAVLVPHLMLTLEVRYCPCVAHDTTRPHELFIGGCDQGE